MSNLIQGIVDLPAWLVLVITGTVVFAEDALFIGFVLPGETLALLAGASAERGHVALVGVLLVVVVAAIVGDTVGYEVGRYLGPWLLGLPLLERRRQRLDTARRLLIRRGGVAVFVGRWVAFLRTVLPPLAGMARMPYVTFLAWNATGGIVWGTGVVLLGYAAGASYTHVAQGLGGEVAGILLALVIVGVVVWHIRRHRAARRLMSGRP